MEAKDTVLCDWVKMCIRTVPAPTTDLTLFPLQGPLTSTSDVNEGKEKASYSYLYFLSHFPIPFLLHISAFIAEPRVQRSIRPVLHDT